MVTSEPQAVLVPAQTSCSAGAFFISHLAPAGHWTLHVSAPAQSSEHLPDPEQAIEQTVAPSHVAWQSPLSWHVKVTLGVSFPKSTQVAPSPHCTLMWLSSSMLTLQND